MRKRTRTRSDFSADYFHIFPVPKDAWFFMKQTCDKIPINVNKIGANIQANAGYLKTSQNRYRHIYVTADSNIIRHHLRDLTNTIQFISFDCEQQQKACVKHLALTDRSQEMRK